tara:strand:- start:4234 stop:5328 length:1095 start_codon:yes stop_codon:yes gene_type:complete
MDTTAGLTALTVASVTSETDSAVRVGFNVPDDARAAFRYQPGQYLTLETEIAGVPVRRSYSICTGIHEPCLEVAIKRVTGGVFSNYANDSLRVGDIVKSLPPRGEFSAALKAEHDKSYLFIAAGSGITPVISNVKSILEQEPKSRVTLLYGNQRTRTIMFRESLGFLKNRYMARFHWINILSREDQGCDVLNGRLDNRKGAALNAQLIDLHSFDEYFVCGPESMISEISRGLRSVGVGEDNIRYELFAGSAEDARQVVAKHHARVREYAGQISRVTMVIDDRATEFELGADGENLLDSGLSQGLDLPFSCKGGVCSTCKAKLLAGEVDMDITYGLEPGEAAKGFILTCQAHPISDSVVVDFDQR